MEVPRDNLVEFKTVVPLNLNKRFGLVSGLTSSQRTVGFSRDGDWGLQNAFRRGRINQSGQGNLYTCITHPVLTQSKEKTQTRLRQNGALRDLLGSRGPVLRP